GPKATPPPASPPAPPPAPPPTSASIPCALAGPRCRADPWSASRVGRLGASPPGWRVRGGRSVANPGGRRCAFGRIKGGGGRQRRPPGDIRPNAHRLPPPHDPTEQTKRATKQPTMGR